MNQHKNSVFGLIGWCTASLFYAYHGSIVALFTVISSSLMDTLHISTTQYGMISTLYTVGYASIQIPVGILLDHFSVKRLMTSAILAFALGCLVLALFPSYTMILITRLLMGMSAAFAVLGAFRIASEWFDSRYFATLAGLTVTLGYLGRVVGNKPFLMFYQSNSFEMMFVGLALVGILLAVLSLIFIRNFTPISQQSSFEPNSILQDIKVVSCNKLSLALIFYAMLVFTPLQIFIDTLGPLFFQSYYSYTIQDATTVMDVIVIASALAAPLLGLISDRMGKRRPLITAAPVLLLICFALILLRIDTTIPGDQLWVTLALFALFGSMTWGFLLAYSVFKETHNQNIVSTGLGLMQTANMAGGIVAVPIITGFIDYLPTMSPGMTMQDIYFYAFLVLPGCVLLSIPLLKHIPETNCKQLYD